MVLFTTYYWSARPIPSRGRYYVVLRFGNVLFHAGPLRILGTQILLELMLMVFTAFGVALTRCVSPPRQCAAYASVRMSIIEGGYRGACSTQRHDVGAFEMSILGSGDIHAGVLPVTDIHNFVPASAWPRLRL